MDSFQICQLVVVCINTGAEKEPGVSAVDDLGHIAELDEVGLVFLVARGDEAVNLNESEETRERKGKKLSQEDTTTLRVAYWVSTEEGAER